MTQTVMRPGSLSHSEDAEFTPNGGRVPRLSGEMHCFRLYPNTNMEFLLKNIFWTVLLVVSGVLYLWNLTRSEGGDLSPQDAVNLINRERGILIDVREAGQFGESHLAGARNIPLAQLESRLAELEKSKGGPIVVYGAGSESNRAVKLLRKQGFEKAAGLEGGLKAWTEAGLPVES